MFVLQMSNTDNISMVQEQKSVDHKLQLTILLSPLLTNYDHGVCFDLVIEFHPLRNLTNE